MPVRIAYNYALQAFFWAAFSLLVGIIRYFSNPLPTIGVMFLGLFTGGGLGVVASLRVLHKLEKKNEYQASLSTFLLLLGASFVVIALFLPLLSNTPIIMLTLFAAPFLTGMSAATTSLYLNWEVRHRSYILADYSLRTILYVSPRIRR